RGKRLGMKEIGMRPADPSWRGREVPVKIIGTRIMTQRTVVETEIPVRLVGEIRIPPAEQLHVTQDGEHGICSPRHLEKREGLLEKTVLRPDLPMLTGQQHAGLLQEEGHVGPGVEPDT